MLLFDVQKPCACFFRALVGVCTSWAPVQTFPQPTLNLCLDGASRPLNEPCPTLFDRPHDIVHHQPVHLLRRRITHLDLKMASALATRNVRAAPATVAATRSRKAVVVKVRRIGVAHSHGNVDPRCSGCPVVPRLPYPLPAAMHKSLALHPDNSTSVSSLEVLHAVPHAHHAHCPAPAPARRSSPAMWLSAPALLPCWRWAAWPSCPSSAAPTPALPACPAPRPPVSSAAV
jgi:hypothetical protein